MHGIPALTPAPTLLRSLRSNPLLSMRIHIFALMVALAAPALAQPALDIRINFGGGSPSNGTWNNPLLNAGAADLLTAQGNASGISMTVTDNFHSTASSGWSGTSGFLGDDNWLSEVAAESVWYVYNANPTGTITFSGLDDNISYRFDLVAGHVLDGIGDYTLNNAYASATQAGAEVAASDNWRMNSDGYAPKNWMVWTGVTPASGSITLNVTFTGGTFTMLNAVRISAVPEPSTYALLFGLLAAGGAIALRVRQKRR